MPNKAYLATAKVNGNKQAFTVYCTSFDQAYLEVIDVIGVDNRDFSLICVSNWTMEKTMRVIKDFLGRKKLKMVLM
ncbi:hypothetical protein [Listeria ilorinensis]|uniref:hypothetical protein n=1 Tax=Listeria ilorinensis TaxID=2867439 RepID=UPI001EF460EB|nr:hypothetical protein [Listeria ilorinensis]